MSFYQDLVAATSEFVIDVASIVTATDVSRVYGGRGFRKVKGNIDVWIEWVPSADVSGDGAQHIVEHQVRLNIRAYRPLKPAETATGGYYTVEDHLQTLFERYNGLQPFTDISNCFTIKAEEEDIEVDEDDAKLTAGALLVSFFVTKP